MVAYGLQCCLCLVSAFVSSSAQLCLVWLLASSVFSIQWFLYVSILGSRLWFSVGSFIVFLLFVESDSASWGFYLMGYVLGCGEGLC